METTIIKTIKGAQMEQLFDTQHEKMNIKYYNAKNVKDADYLSTKKYKFEILIRHGEEENANELFDEAFCKMFPTPKKTNQYDKLLLSLQQLCDAVEGCANDKKLPDERRHAYAHIIKSAVFHQALEAIKKAV